MELNGQIYGYKSSEDLKNVINESHLETNLMYFNPQNSSGIGLNSFMNNYLNRIKF